MSDLPEQPQTVMQPSGITFLRRTTTEITDRQADGDITTEVKHVARFAVEPGTVADQTRKYGVRRFRPIWLEATWRNGKLSTVHLSGPRVLKAGLSEKENADYDWGVNYQTGVFDRDRLPAPVPAALAAYEVAVGSGPERTRESMPR